MRHQWTLQAFEPLVFGPKGEDAGSLIFLALPGTQAWHEVFNYIFCFILNRQPNLFLKVAGAFVLGFPGSSSMAYQWRMVMPASEISCQQPYQCVLLLLVCLRHPHAQTGRPPVPAFVGSAAALSDVFSRRVPHTFILHIGIRHRFTDIRTSELHISHYHLHLWQPSLLTPTLCTGGGCCFCGAGKG